MARGSQAPSPASEPLWLDFVAQVPLPVLSWAGEMPFTEQIGSSHYDHCFFVSPSTDDPSVLEGIRGVLSKIYSMRFDHGH